MKNDRLRVMLSVSGDLRKDIENKSKEYNLPLATTCQMLIAQAIRHDKESKEMLNKLPDVFKDIAKNENLTTIVKDIKAKSNKSDKDI